MLDFQCQTVFHVILCWSLFSSKQCVIKQLLDSVFVLCEIIKARGKCYEPRPSAWLVMLTQTLLVRISQKLHPIIVY